MEFRRKLLFPVDAPAKSIASKALRFLLHAFITLQPTVLLWLCTKYMPICSFPSACTSRRRASKTSEPSALATAPEVVAPFIPMHGTVFCAGSYRKRSQVKSYSLGSSMLACFLEVLIKCHQRSRFYSFPVKTVIMEEEEEEEETLDVTNGKLR